MRCFETGIVRVLMVAAGIVGSGAAHGAAQRTFVASAGADANVCSITQPCRSFGRAITQTNAGGEIVVLDSAGYGPVAIGQAVSIVAPPGVYAGISVFTGDGVAVNAPGAVVVLRGLTINGQGGDNGIAVAAAQAVHVENVTVGNMGLSGIYVSANVPVTIKDSNVRGNLGAGIGVYAGTVTMENVRSERNGAHGLYVGGGTVAVGSSVFSQNGGSGVHVDGGSLNTYASMIAGNTGDGVFANGVQATFERCSIDGNGANGLEAHGSFATPAVVSLTGSSVSSNGQRGAFANSSFAYIALSRTTLRSNATADVDASNCCVITYQNNEVGILTGTFVTTYAPF